MPYIAEYIWIDGTEPTAKSCAAIIAVLVGHRERGYRPRESARPALGRTATITNGIRWVSDQLGHSDPAFTLRTYTHVLQQSETDLSFVDFSTFGGGTKQCIGEPLARLEATIILSRLIQHFNFEHCSADEIKPRPSIVLEPLGGLPMRLMKADE